MSTPSHNTKRFEGFDPDRLDATLDLPPCQAACPVGTDIPSYAALIWDGNLEAAMETIAATNPFSSICGRVCAAPCEAGCKRGDNDGAVTIRQLKRFVTDRLGSDYHLPPVAVTRKESIGIVGGGPTGLTAAQNLAEAGYTVHIYEQADRLGGMMNTIPRFRLPPELIQQDIQRILDHCPGITVHLDMGLGNEVSLEELKQRHDAVLIAIGLCKDRSLSVPGEDPDLNGIYGVDLLHQLSRGESIELNGPTVVVGGGNVAMDMARTALRCGSRQVDLYCLESREEMPAWEHEILQAEAEGVCIHNGWGPKEICSESGRISQIIFKRCTAVFDSDGRFNPTFSQETKTCDAVHLLLAIGQEAENDELTEGQLLSNGRVTSMDEQGRTADTAVFTAGDCAYGPSAIVYAMHQGHKAAYYIRAAVEGINEPEPFRPSYGMRHVPVAQEPMWETLPQETTHTTKIDKDCRFAECELPFDADAARRQAGRCLRCDAQTGTANYARRARNLIQAMSRIQPEDETRQLAVFRTLLEPRENPYPPSRGAHLDDVVFLSAALTRLVIDPYREACSTRTKLTRTIELLARSNQTPAVDLDQPFLVTGFDRAPEEIRVALAKSLAETGCGYIGVAPLNGHTSDSDVLPPWFQLITEGDVPSPDAHAQIHVPRESFEPVALKRQHPDQLLGLSVKVPDLERAIPWALEQKLDLLVLDGTIGIQTPWAELRQNPDVTVMRDAIRLLREMNMEEEIALVNYGGMRSGTDVAKALALNCNASVFGVAMGVAMGGRIDKETMVFEGMVEPADRQNAAVNWIKGTAQEVAIIARCTGKTDVHNLEPEDMRSITLSTAEALALPLASGQTQREGF